MMVSMPPFGAFFIKQKETPHTEVCPFECDDRPASDRYFNILTLNTSVILSNSHMVQCTISELKMQQQYPSNHFPSSKQFFMYQTCRSYEPIFNPKVGLPLFSCLHLLIQHVVCWLAYLKVVSIRDLSTP